MKDFSILIAEDDESLRELLSEKLTQEGFTVYGAKNGKEAVSMNNEYAPGIILMDILMPDMNGLEAIEAIRSTSDSQILPPIIALTNLDDPQTVNKALMNNVVAYIVKSESSLAEIVDKIKMQISLL